MTDVVPAGMIVAEPAVLHVVVVRAVAMTGRVSHPVDQPIVVLRIATVVPRGPIVRAVTMTGVVVPSVVARMIAVNDVRSAADQRVIVTVVLQVMGVVSDVPSVVARMTAVSVGRSARVVRRPIGIDVVMTIDVRAVMMTGVVVPSVVARMIVVNDVRSAADQRVIVIDVVMMTVVAVRTIAAEDSPAVGMIDEVMIVEARPPIGVRHSANARHARSRRIVHVAAQTSRSCRRFRKTLMSRCCPNPCWRNSRRCHRAYRAS